jgi:hypothetical protein
VTLSPAWLATLIIAASAGDPALSARLKALLRDVKCLAQAVRRSINAFESSAGLQFIITATERRLTGNVLQHCCVRGINQCSDVVIGSLLTIRR